MTPTPFDQKTSLAELKPCPFCGGKGRRPVGDNLREDCGCVTPPRRPEERIVTCEVCGGDGGWEVAETGPYGYRYDPNDGALITHWRKCEACAGTGQVAVEVQPIDLSDLAEIPGDDDPLFGIRLSWRKSMTASEDLERREREIEDASYKAMIWHPDMSCGHIDCVNGCDGAPDYCVSALAAIAKAKGR
jgi:hypothetical protein